MNNTLTAKEWLEKEEIYDDYIGSVSQGEDVGLIRMSVEMERYADYKIKMLETKPSLQEVMGGYLKIEKQFLPGKSTADFTDAELGQIVKKCSYYVSKDDAIKEAIEVLCNALREDTSEGSYYYSLQANIAMQFKDEFWKTYRSMSRYYVDFEDKMLVDEDKIHEISNEAAKNFLNLLIKK